MPNQQPGQRERLDHILKGLAKASSDPMVLGPEGETTERKHRLHLEEVELTNRHHHDGKDRDIDRGLRATYAIGFLLIIAATTFGFYFLLYKIGDKTLTFSDLTMAELLPLGLGHIVTITILIVRYLFPSKTNQTESHK